MTTAVTVDAHAGWPVEVISVMDASGPIQREVVPANTQKVFYLHGNFQIVSVRELDPKHTE